MLATSGQVGLLLYDRGALEALVGLDRAGRPWCEGFPTEGDVLVGRLLLESGAPLPTSGSPWGPLAVCDLSDGLVVGGLGFKGPPDAEGTAEIGYGIAAPRRGRGIATDAVRAAAVLARDRGVRALVADTDTDNVPSQRVLLANGFVPWEPPRDQGAPAPTTLWWRLALAG